MAVTTQDIATVSPSEMLSNTSDGMDVTADAPPIEDLCNPPDHMAVSTEVAAKDHAPFTTLPTELIVHIFAKLPKSDLKSMRLVHSRFVEITHPCLFDKAIISSNPEEIEAFQGIINDPRLAANVTTLVFDVQTFRNITFPYYIEHLVKQIGSDLMARRVANNVQDIPDSLREILEAVQWFKDPGRTHSREQICSVFEGQLVDGYNAYTEMRYKRMGLAGWRSGAYILHSLERCTKVRQAEVQTMWKHYEQPVGEDIRSLLPVYRSSGIVSRRWHPLYLRPAAPVRDGLPWDPFLAQLCMAISNSSKHISNLIVGNGCPMPGNEVGFTERYIRNIATLHVFRNLTSLTFGIPVTHLPTTYYLLDCLGPALRAAQNLKHLRFGADNTSGYGCYDTMRLDLYPLFEDCVMPQLDSLDMYGLVAPVKDLLTFLNDQEALKSLRLTAIDLKETNNSDEWLRFLAGLRSVLKIENFSIGWPIRSQLDWPNWKVHGGADEAGDEWTKLKADIEQYVLRKTGTSSLANSDD
ncbi:MAG: hypothetical protein Q9201_003355 [Fulgogasparrea decipioides]